MSRRCLYLWKLKMNRKPEVSGTSSQGPTKSKKTQDDGRRSGRNWNRTLFEHRSTALELSQPVCWVAVRDAVMNSPLSLYIYIQGKWGIVFISIESGKCFEYLGINCQTFQCALQTLDSLTPPPKRNISKNKFKKTDQSKERGREVWKGRKRT